VITSKQGNALVGYIINTQLRLPQGNSFRQNNPAPGIASVVINQTDSNSIRMVVTGTTSAPSSQIAQRNAQGITLSISRASGTAALPPLAPAPPTFANTPALNASPQPTSSRRGAAQPGQRSTAQRQNILVPNPEVTIDGAPAPATGTQQVNPAPPVLPRAIAPPVGDIAISNSDASPSTIDLGSSERVPRLVLRDAPVREVLALLARAAGLNLAFSTAAPAGQGQPDQNAAAAANNEGPRISLDIQDESVQDVFNYVLRISGLQANRSGRTIFVATRLSNQARDVIVRSYRLNQVTVGVALNFLVGFGAESAVSRERTITSVNAVPVGGSTTPATQTQTSTETRIETQRIEFQDSVPLLRGLQALGDERTNSITLIGTPKQIDLATTQLIQLDSRRRQIAVNVKIVDVNLLATDNFRTSFSFGLLTPFFRSNAGNASVNFGGFPGAEQFAPIAPPSRFLAELTAQIISGNGKILTDPTLIVQEGQQANVNLTQEVLGNITSQTNITAGSALQTINPEKQRVGLTLTLRIERIDDNGFVSLSVAPVVSAPQGEEIVDLGSGQRQRIILVSERSLNSGLIRLRDGQTLILSGIIQESDRTNVSKIPILGDIPILGALFRSTQRENQRQEVIVLLTPQVIEDAADSSFGYNYKPGQEARQMLELQRRGSQVPSNNPTDLSTGEPSR
jgi:type IV pilus assembly protein PilQ